MNKDIIYREDAIKAVEDVSENYTKEGDREWHPHIDFITQALVQVSSVPPKQGEWIDAEIPLESGGSMPIQACNLCKTFYPLAYTGGGHRFCPNCGARMLKGAEAEG